MSSGVLERHRPLTTLVKLTVGALLGAALAFTILLLTIFFATGDLVIALLIVAIGLLLVAGIVATGVRWTPILGALVGFGTMLGGVLTQQYFVYHLMHPAEVEPFLLCLLVCVFAIVAIFTGIGATVQNYRGNGHVSAPSWLPIPFSALGGFVLGAFFVALLIAVKPQTSINTTSANGIAVVHMGVSTFSQSTVTVKKGSKLTLTDDGQFLHILENGAWANGTPRQATESGAPSIQNLNVNGNSVDIGPFNTAGTFHIYCTIHPGMNLIVVVQ